VSILRRALHESTVVKHVPAVTRTVEDVGSAVECLAEPGDVKDLHPLILTGRYAPLTSAALRASRVETA
jgi:hypothetical protein